MLKDEIKNKIQLEKWVKSTQVNLTNLNHETKITPYKKIKTNYEAWFLVNSMLQDEIKKKRQKSNHSQPKLTDWTYNSSHKAEITL